MGYSYSYIFPNAQQYDDHRYSTKVRIETPDLSFSSSHYTSNPASSRVRSSACSPRDEQYYDYHHDYHHDYCYGAGPSYPAYSSNWEHNRAASPRLHSQRIRIRSDACLDESPSRHPHRGSNTYQYSGRDRAVVRPVNTSTRRTTITITTM